MISRLSTLIAAFLLWLTPALADNTVVICKKDMTLRVIDSEHKVVFQTGIACGTNRGNKTRRGDHKTPEGSFKINQIVPSSYWDHDFKDGKGKIKGAYGPWFMRLAVPGFTHIGIHGTHDPASIGHRASEGCVRLKNSELIKLHKLVNIGTRVIILPESQAFDHSRNY